MIIKIKNLKLRTKIGIYDFEEKIDRELIINIKIKTDEEKSVKSDEVKDTIDYDEIVAKVTDIVKNKRFKLIEALAGALIDSIMMNKKIKECKLEVDKVGIAPDYDSASVILKRENS